MKRDDVFLASKLLVQMRNFADKLDEAQKKEDINQIRLIKIKFLELQRSFKKLL